MKIQEVSTTRTYFTESGSKDTVESLKLVRHLRLEAPIRRQQLLRCYGGVYTIPEFEATMLRPENIRNPVKLEKMRQHRHEKVVGKLAKGLMQAFPRIPKNSLQTFSYVD